MKDKGKRQNINGTIHATKRSDNTGSTKYKTKRMIKMQMGMAFKGVSFIFLKSICTLPGTELGFIRDPMVGLTISMVSPFKCCFCAIVALL
jgi:hypothetical protein